MSILEVLYNYLIKELLTISIGIILDNFLLVITYYITLVEMKDDFKERLK